MFALISDSEGLPVSAIEAIRSGMPLLISNVGCKELINDNGVITDNIPEEIAKNLDYLFNNYQQCSQNFASYFLKILTHK